MRFSQVLHRTYSASAFVTQRDDVELCPCRGACVGVQVDCDGLEPPLPKKECSGLFILNAPLLRTECAKVPKSGYYGPTCLSSVPRNPGGVSSVCKQPPDAKDEARACRLGVLVPGLRCRGGGLDLAIPGRRATPDVFDLGVLCEVDLLGVFRLLKPTL